ncbi:S-layer homology domain-containing protein [Agathobaculum sp.]|uniref:S-layer homology domain-containing protein n=1 Tax=Agathobaculum sp. TaxID=2048138 RepID=UPI002A7EB863|nr:S-layer homology domain-containing protein [Agathobaculum sp.]MDY3619483.1 S-layer homology domain-containing protein [Agathobaculum sp.]
MNEPKRRTGLRRGLSLLLSLCMLLSLLPTAALATGGGTPTPTVDGYNIYANGVPLVLAAGSTDTSKTVIYIDNNDDGAVDSGDTIFDPDGDGAMVDNEVGNDLSSHTVYGGGISDLTGGTKITMRGGAVSGLYGGGNRAAVGSASVTVDGGSVEELYGGGSSGEVTGAAAVSVTGGTVNMLYGGGGDGAVDSASVTVDGGTVMMLYGGGLGAAVTHAATVSVTGGGVECINGGGFRDGTVGEGSAVTVGGAAEIGSVSGIGVSINGGTENVTNGVDSFAIAPDLSSNASVWVRLPEGYTSGTIATGAVAGDLDQITLSGTGALGKEAYFEDNSIKVRGAAPAPTVDGNNIYANGVALIIDGSSETSTTVYVDVDRDGVIDVDTDKSLAGLGIQGAPADNSDLSGYTVYGGGTATLTGDTKITMTGGKVNYLYGGGNNSEVTGTAEVTVADGEVTGDVCGGGAGSGAATGGTKVTVTGGTLMFNVCGGGDGNGDTVNGNICVTITGGTVMGSVCGDSRGSTTVTGDVSVTVSGTADVGLDVTGGSGTVSGSVAITVTGGTVDRSIRGKTGGAARITVGGSVKIGQSILDSDGVPQDSGIIINGGSGVASFAISPNLTGAADSVYVVLPYGYDVANTPTIATGAVEADLAKIKLVGEGAAGNEAFFESGAIKVRAIPAPAPAPTVDVSRQNIFANGGEIKIVAGTGANCTNVLYDINNDGEIGDTEYLKIGDVAPTAEGYDLSNYSIYGGNNTAITADPKITMTGGNVRSIYGGGYNTNGTVTGSPTVTVTGGTVNMLYGGGKYAVVTGSPTVSVTGGEVIGAVYGGGYGETVSGTAVTISGSADVGTVYGGGQLQDGTVTGNTSVTVTGGEVGWLYGGGDSADVGGNTSISISGGKVIRPYGGGYNGSVTGEVSVTVTGGKVSWLYGGGYANAGSSVQNATANVAGAQITVSDLAEVSYIYGGGDAYASSIIGSVTATANVTGAAKVSITGGKVTGYVYGGGNPSADETSNATATVGGGSSLTVGGAAQIGNPDMNLGVAINGGTEVVTKGVASFIIGEDLTGSVCVKLPEGYSLTDSPIATEAIEADLASIKLVGNGAAGVGAYFDTNAIKLRPSIGGTITAQTTKAQAAAMLGNKANVSGNPGELTIKLNQNIELTQALTFEGGTGYTLDLLGNTLTAGAISTQPPVIVNGDAKLTVTDASGTGGGSIIGRDGDVDNLPTPAIKVESGSLTLNGNKPFTLRGGNGAAADDGTGEGAIGVTGEANTTVTISGTGAILVQGGDANTSNTNDGGDGVSTRGSLTVTNPNATLQGGNGSAQCGTGSYVAGKLTVTAGRFVGGSGTGSGGNGCRTNNSAESSVTGGVFQGGAGSSENGAGLKLFGTVKGDLSGLTCTGGTGSGAYGDGLELFLAEQASAVIESGTFAGEYGMSVAGICTVKGGTFTGDTSGLCVYGGQLTVTGGTFIGGEYGLQYEYGNIQLSGGTFTGDGENAYAVYKLDGTAEELLAPNHAYFGADGNPITTGLAGDKLGQNATLRVAAETAQPEKLYGISGTVTDKGDSNKPVPSATVTLRQGANTLRTVTTDSHGEYSFAGIAAGLYNVAAAKDGKTKTILVELVDADATEQNIALPADNKSSVVEVTNGAPPVVAGGVEAVAEAQLDGGTVVVTLVVQPETNSEDKDKIDGAADGQTVGLYLDLSLLKKVDTNEPTAINDTGDKVLEVVVPYDLAGKKNVTIYRVHDGQAKALTQDDSGDDGTYRLDTAKNRIHIFASKFSTYAVAYVTPAAPSTGGSTTYYTLTATAGEGGKLDPSGAVRVSRNGGKTFTITPNKGYEIADVLVDGKSVGAVETYTFEQVTKNHTIAASFRPEGHWNPFTDVADGAWYYNSVKYVYENGLMVGTAGDKFSPGADTSRGMIVTILHRLENEPESKAEMAFADVAAGSYCYDAVLWAAEQGIVKGYGNGNFGPNDPITRQELAAILWRYAQYKGMDVSVGENTNILSYTDIGEAGEWAIPALQWACGAGLINGKGGGVLDPTGHATRAEAAAMLQRFVSPAAN